MCPLKFCDHIVNFENILMGDPSSYSSCNDLKVYKASKDREGADYICYTCNVEESEIWKVKLLERVPWMKEYIQVKVAPQGFHLCLTRHLCFVNGLKDVLTSGSDFGSNTSLNGKVFEIYSQDAKEPECLINLRINLLSKILRNIIPACGGSLDLAEPRIKLCISSNQVFSEGLGVVVGPVVCKSTPSNYRRIRLQEISEMCENKLNLSESTSQEDIDNMLNAAILFDFFQSSVWRSVTLRVQDESPDVKTTCKGALFVLYNYARLSSLCSQFDEKVTSGIYPSLPSLEEVDFSSLTQEDEWRLMFHSLLSWPIVLRNAIKDLEWGKPKIHLVFQFLRITATNFSHYYHRTRIFTDSRSHLLPTLFARIHLLKGLLTIYRRALFLVSIIPLNKM